MKKICFTTIKTILVLMAVLCHTAAAEDRINVLILPFDVYAENDMAFLQKGIQSMLTTRIAQNPDLAVMDSSAILQPGSGLVKPVTESTALSLGKKLSADYVLFGSLTVFGDSISTDAQCMDVHKKIPAVVFHKTGSSKGDVISHVSLFGTMVSDTLLNKGGGSTSLQVDAPVAVIPETPKKSTPEETPPPMVSTGEQKPLDYWKSQNFKTNIRSLDSGDVDGDGNDEIVFISSKDIFICRYVDGRLQKLDEIEGKSHKNYLNVDVADINANGRSEIFITYYTLTGEILDSFVLEKKETAFEKIADHQPWYFRIIHDSKRGPILLGQKTRQSQKKMKDDIFSGPVYELKWSGTGYEPATEQMLPAGMNIYGFTYGDALNNGNDMILALTQGDKIHLFDKNGNDEWTSDENYGGGLTYIEYTFEHNTEDTDKYYLPQRVHIADIDGDGKNEAIVVKNEDAAGRVFTNLRMFNSGHIECLELNDLGPVLKWKTQKISGYISDYVIADLNNDGKSEIIFSVVSKTGSVIQKDKSYIVAWGMAK